MTGQHLRHDFAGRVVIITGAWRGLGRAAAERFREHGADVAVNVRDRVRADNLAASIGGSTLAVPGDVAAPGVAEEIVRMTLERFGRVDVVVNNAALARSTRFADLTAEEWRVALEVNLTAPFLLTQAALPAMQAQRYGSLPVAHRTGGLADTIEDGETGFLFAELSGEGLFGACCRAFQAFDDPEVLAKMRRAAAPRSLSGRPVGRSRARPRARWRHWLTRP